MSVTQLKSLLLASFLFLSPWAEGSLQIPGFSAPVVDQAALLGSAERATLERRLIDIQQSGGPQIAILTIRSLEGESLEEYSIHVAEKWKAGNSKLGDGVIILVSKDDRKVRIEVGQGIEGSLTDAISSQIIRHTIGPAFREGNYSRGLASAVEEIAGVVTGKIAPSSYGHRTHSRIPGNVIWLFLMIGFFFISGGNAYSNTVGRRRRGVGSVWWGGGLGGGGFSSGSGFGGGNFGGGGFSGGGGGGFSGGGSSGGW